MGERRGDFCRRIVSNRPFPAESEMYFPSSPGSSRLRSISLAGILDTCHLQSALPSSSETNNRIETADKLYVGKRPT